MRALYSHPQTHLFCKDGVVHSCAQMVRNIMEISPAGTLATVTEDGWPLGTYMPFVLNSNADPILKVHIGPPTTVDGMCCSISPRPMS